MQYCMLSNSMTKDCDALCHASRKCLLKFSHFESVPLKVVLHSAWGANYNVHPSAKGTFLGLVGAATIQAQRAELVRFADPFKISMDL